jgi:hypothetical protein
VTITSLLREVSIFINTYVASRGIILKTTLVLPPLLCSFSWKFTLFFFFTHFSGVHPVFLFIMVLRLFTHNGCFCRLFEDSQESVYHHSKSRGRTHRGGDNFGSFSFCRYHLFIPHRCQSNSPLISVVV